MTKVGLVNNCSHPTIAAATLIVEANVSKESGLLFEGGDQKRMQRIYAGVMRAYEEASLQSCLVPGCSTGGEVIKAHSIQEKRVLGAVSENGHVYMIKNTTKGLGLQLVGVRKASRFTGFCSYHDNDLFDKVDLGDGVAVDPDNPEQAVRLSLRSTACEFWKKLNGQKFFGELLRLARNRDVDGIANYVNIDKVDAAASIDFTIFFAGARLAGLDFAVRRIGRQFHSLLRQLESGKYHLSKICALRLDAPASVVVSSHFPPEYDLTGKCIVPKRPGADLPEVTLNVIPVDGKTVLMFLWHKRFEPLFRPLFSGIEKLGDSEKSLVLSQMLVMQVENMALSPRLVDLWSDRQKSTVIDLFRKTSDASVPYSDDWSIDLFR